VSCGSLAASAPFLAVLLGVIVVTWIQAARALAVEFAEVSEAQEKAANDAIDAKAVSETEMTARPA
jgi:ATP/ADP translocase